MPDIYTHYIFGGKVYNNLPPEIIRRLDRSIFDFALNGPDDWATYRFLTPLSRHGKQRRSGIMHTEKTGAFLLALADGAKSTICGNEMLSYLAGYLCHYCLDAGTHPYVNARAGIFDGSDETKKYRGRHLALEHSIDLRMMQSDNMTIKDRPITKRTFSLMRLPDNMKTEINRAYYAVYGWNDVFDELNTARCDLKRFYLIAEDPKGTLHYSLYPFRKRIPSYFAASYYKDAFLNKDSLNEAHAEWHHPFDDSLVSNDSFFDLAAKAEIKAAAMIRAAYDYSACMTLRRDTLKEIFGNMSYSTGFDLRDERGEKKPDFSLLL